MITSQTVVARTYEQKQESLKSTLGKLSEGKEPSRISLWWKKTIESLRFFVKKSTFKKFKVFVAGQIFTLRLENDLRAERIQEYYQDLEKRIGNLESAIYIAEVGERLTTVESSAPAYTNKAYRRLLRKNAELEATIEGLKVSLGQVKSKVDANL